MSKQQKTKTSRRSNGTAAVANLPTPPGPPPAPNMMWIPGGTFTMGSNDFYPEEAPTHRASVGPFWMDKYQVTNRDFERFIKDTDYITVAERQPDPALYPDALPHLLVPGSLVFQKTKSRVDLRDYRQWWAFVPGTNWRQPGGPGTSLRKLAKHPVVHVAYEDAVAYAKWAGKELATEAQWEFAARGGIDGATYTWGEEFAPKGKMMANTWQGEFPWQNSNEDGYEGTAPVGSFAPNGYGLFDMAGNVWEWTNEWFSQGHSNGDSGSCCTPDTPRRARKEESYDPTQPQIRIPRRVTKGGSFLCAPNYCLRYRPAARTGEMIDTSTCHIGFRCVVNV